MTALSVRMREEGIQLGMQQGMQQGMQKGEAELLLRLVRSKFGPRVAQQYEARIRQADLQMLERWGDAILEVRTVEELFE